MGKRVVGGDTLREKGCRVYGLLKAGIEPDELHMHERLPGGHVGEQMLMGLRLAWCWADEELEPWDFRWNIPGVRLYGFERLWPKREGWDQL